MEQRSLYLGSAKRVLCALIFLFTDENTALDAQVALSVKSAANSSLGLHLRMLVTLISCTILPSKVSSVVSLSFGFGGTNFK